jgi:hypothetical protein
MKTSSRQELRTMRSHGNSLTSGALSSPAVIAARIQPRLGPSYQVAHA